MKHIETLIQELKKKTKYELDEQEHEQAVSALIARLYDPRVEFRKEAVELLAKLGDPRAIDHLIEKIYDIEDSVRIASAKALTQLRVREAVPHLIYMFENDREDHVRAHAAEFLGEMRDPQAVPHLIQALNTEKSFFVRLHIVMALAQVADPQAVEPLADMMDGFVQPHWERVTLEQASARAIQMLAIAHPDAVLQLPPHKRQRVERERHTMLHQELEKALCQQNQPEQRKKR